MAEQFSRLTREHVEYLADPDSTAMRARFGAVAGARQIFELAIDLVQTACGMGVPLYAPLGDRPQLPAWAGRLGDLGLSRFWHRFNTTSIDGLPTGIVEGNLKRD